MDTIVILCLLGSFSLLVNLAFAPGKTAAPKMRKETKKPKTAPRGKELPGRKGVVNYREEVRKMFLADSEGMAKAIKGSLDNRDR